MVSHMLGSVKVFERGHVPKLVLNVFPEWKIWICCETIRGGKVFYSQVDSSWDNIIDIPNIILHCFFLKPNSFPFLFLQLSHFATDSTLSYMV